MSERAPPSSTDVPVLKDSVHDSAPTDSNSIIETAGIKPEHLLTGTDATDKYSDYDIEIETHGNYEDALFADADAIDEALAGGDEPQPKASPKDAASDQPASQDNNVTPRPEDNIEPLIDLQHFLSPYVKERKFQLGVHLFSKNSCSLALSDEGLNGIEFRPESLVLSDTEALLAADFSPPEEELEPAPETVAQPEDGSVLGRKLLKAKSLLGSGVLRARSGLEEYIGKSLPQRDIALQFNLPKPREGRDQESAHSVSDIRKLFDGPGLKPLRALTVLADGLTATARCKLSRREREQLLQCYQPYLLAELNSLSKSIQKTPGCARSPQRLELLELAKTCLKQMVSGYRQLYAPLYEAANSLYGPQRSSANRTLFKLMDWLCFEQQFSLTCQSPLPASSYRSAHTLFMIAARFEPAEIDRLQVTVCAPGDRDEVSIRQLYSRFLTLSLCRPWQLSPRLLPSLLNYADSHWPLLKILPLDSLEQGNHWRIAADCERPPRYGDCDSPSELTVVADGLFKQIIRDYSTAIDALGSGGADDSATAARHVALSMLNHLYACIVANMAGHQHQIYSHYQPQSLRMYGGLEGLLQWSHYNYEKNLQQNMAVGGTVRQKPEQKAQLPTMPKAARAEWRQAAEDSQQLWLQVDEASTGLNIELCEPLLIDSSENGDRQLQLLQIDEVQRLQSGLVNLRLNKLATDFTAVSIGGRLPAQARALLFYTHETLCLLCNVGEELWKGKTLELTLLDGSSWVVCIKSLLSDSGRVQRYELF